MLFRNILRRARAQQPPGQDQTLGSSLALSPKIWRQLDRLRLRAGRFLYGQGVGQRPSVRRKPAMDFREHRKYVPGDDVRYVDWQASARHEQVFLKQGEQAKETTVYVLIDTSASMAWGEPPKHEAALSLIAALSYLALAHEDRLVIQSLGGEAEKFIGPVSGKGQFPTVMNFLPAISFGGRLDFVRAIRGFSRGAAKGGRVIILSDLLDVEDVPGALKYLPAPTWDVTLIHFLHPHEITPEIRGYLELIDLETGLGENYDLDSSVLTAYNERLETWRNAVELACIENHVFYTLISTGWSLEKEIIPHLQQVRVLEPV